MRPVDRRHLAVALAGLLVVAGLAYAGVAVTAGHAPDQPDHGVAPDEFARLWSGDADTAGAQTNGTPLAELTDRTDLPRTEPTPAVEQWNRGAFEALPETGHNASLVPADADPSDHHALRDAHLSVFAVQPTTTVLHTANGTRRYAARNGSVYAVVDSRVQIPESYVSGNRSVTWTLTDHAVPEVTLGVDNETVDRATGPRAVLDYRNLSAHERVHTAQGVRHSLSVNATVRATFSRVVETCRNRSAGTCTEWHPTVQGTRNLTLYRYERLSVTEWRPHIQGTVATFPDGSHALRIGADQPWSAVSLPGGNGTVQSTWSFYSTRDPGWHDAQLSRTDAATRGVQSHVARRYAYPGEAGAQTSGPITAASVSGPDRQSATLPAAVNLDVPEGCYTVPRRTVVDLPASAPVEDTVTVAGIVPGTEKRVDADSLRHVQVRPTDLSVTVNRTRNHSRKVIVDLGDARTGAPIATNRTAGHVTVGGQVVETNATGMATVVVDDPNRPVAVEYRPAAWWRASDPHVAARAVVGGRGPTVAFGGALALVGSVLVLVVVVTVGRVRQSVRCGT